MSERDTSVALRMMAATVSDAADMAALHAVALKGLGQQPWPADAFADILTLPVTLGLKVVDDSRLIAFLLVQAAGGEADILTIVTAPDRRRQGLARRLMMALEDHCRDLRVNKISLEVHAENHAAAGLYAGVGFQVVGQRPNYYKDIRTGERHTAVLMQRHV